MSLILDALNRSRSESGEVPNLDAVHGAVAADSSPRRAWLPWIALAVAALVIVLLLIDRGSSTASGPAGARAPAPAVAVAPAPVAPAVQAPEPAPSKTEATRPVPVPEPEPEPLPEPPPEPLPSAAPLAVAPDEAPGTPRTPVPEVTASAEADPAVAALYARPGAAAGEAAADPVSAGETAPEAVPALPPATREQAIDIEQMIRQAENELEDARLAEHPAPFIAGLSQQVKDGIPTLLYERHDYSGKPGQSRVVLNGQSLARGGTTRGVRVEEILPDSVVLRYGETQFRLRALNSWVNL